MNRRILFIIFIILFVSLDISSAHALTVDELRQQILLKQQEKAQLDIENQKLEQQIDTTGKQAQTLQTAVKTLDTTQKKLTSDLKVTQNKIVTTELSIQELGIEISQSEKQIDQNKKALAETIKTLQEADNSSLIEALLKYKDINELWNNIDTLGRFQTSIKHASDELNILKAKQEDKKNQTVQKKTELVGFKGKLADQKVIVDQTKTTKTQLLSQTKNQEAEYKRLLAINIERGRKFEQELFLYESQLNIAIDSSRLPNAQGGILYWPLDIIKITQRFGKTVDAKRLYVSGTHNGVDFGTSVGTPVKAVLSGVVSGFGNTDEQTGCYSYGRWILIKHSNGLSSLYGHLSLSKITSVGQAVDTGQIIGYSGGQPGSFGSGYSTGPHLHLGLYATQGVHVGQYTASIFCKQVQIPLAGPDAYLDPLAYLPTVN
jgi:murein DD-endopeptidase MepM/ murein hydrolase activator NlpD